MTCTYPWSRRALKSGCSLYPLQTKQIKFFFKINQRQILNHLCFKNDTQLQEKICTKSNYIKITEITEKQQALLLNSICLMFYLNIPSSFFIVTLIQGFKGLGTVPGLRRFLAPLLVPSPRVSQKIQASLVVLAIQLLQGIPEGIHVYKI